MRWWTSSQASGKLGELVHVSVRLFSWICGLDFGLYDNNSFRAVSQETAPDESWVGISVLVVANALSVSAWPSQERGQGLNLPLAAFCYAMLAVSPASCGFHFESIPNLCWDLYLQLKRKSPMKQRLVQIRSATKMPWQTTRIHQTLIQGMSLIASSDFFFWFPG